MKIMMLGLGGIGQRHMRNLRAILGAEAEIFAFDLRRDMPVLTDQLKVEPGVTLEEKYGIRIFLDFEEALAQKPQAAFVCNPTSTHIESAIQAAREGCHLFIEKPLSHSLDRVDELIDLVELKGLTAVVGYQMRFHPCLQRLNELLQEKKIGKVVSARAEIGEYMPGWHTYEDYRHIYASRKDLGGGVILSQIHEFDYLYWLFGLPAQIFTLGGHLSSLEIDVEDTADSLMQCQTDDGIVPVSLHQDYLQRPLSRFCEVFGESGKIRVDLRALTVTVWDGLGNEVEHTAYENFQRNQLFLDELNWFLQAIQGEPTPLVDLRTGKQSLRMALAAKDSLATGKVVRLQKEYA
jgi:predicted dehydrogenase